MDELSEELDRWEQNYILHLIVVHGALYEQAAEYAAARRAEFEHRIRNAAPDFVIEITEINGGWN